MKFLTRANLTLLTSLTLLSGTASASGWTLSNTKDSCVLPSSTPIIPDGNIASEDELFSAQKAVKAFQETLLDYRECLLKQEEALDPENTEQATKIQQLRSLSDNSIQLETRVANEFNIAVRAFKER